MKKTVRWLAASGLALAVGVGLSACGATPTVQGQSGSVTNVRTDQGSKLDAALLSEVDAAIAAAKSRSENVEAAQKLRDSAVELANKGLFEEANGNLKSSAMMVGVLAGADGSAAPAPNPLPALPQKGEVANTGAKLLNASFKDAKNLDGWALVGPKLQEGTPLWELRDGMLVQRGVEGVLALDEQTGFVTGDAAWKDVTVSAEALARDTKELGLIVRQQGDSFYRFRALVLGTGTNSGNYILERVVGDEVTRLATFDGAELSADAWHTLALTAQGQTLTASVDGKELGSAEDATIATGRAGVSTLAMSGAYFANVQVTGR